MARKQKQHDVTRAATATTTRGSIISPVVDFLCVGGLSLLLMIPLLLSGRTDLVLIGAGAQAWIATAINMPHFMASYRLVYGSRTMIRRHQWASMSVDFCSEHLKWQMRARIVIRRQIPVRCSA